MEETLERYDGVCAKCSKPEPSLTPKWIEYTFVIPFDFLIRVLAGIKRFVLSPRHVPWKIAGVLVLFQASFALKTLHDEEVARQDELERQEVRRKSERVDVLAAAFGYGSTGKAVSSSRVASLDQGIVLYSVLSHETEIDELHKFFSRKENLSLLPKVTHRRYINLTTPGASLYDEELTKLEFLKNLCEKERIPDLNPLIKVTPIDSRPYRKGKFADPLSAGEQKK